MENLNKVLIGLSVLGFLIAVVIILVAGPIMGIAAEGFSRASTNLALIAIALSVCIKSPAPDS
jgi:hypothetical protein